MTRDEETAERNACDEWWHAQPNKGASIQEAWVERARRAEEPEQRIPDGWRFYTADFSISRAPGSATLIRDEKGKAWWLGLSDEQREATDLYVYGRGATLREAINDAITKIVEEQQ